MAAVGGAPDFFSPHVAGARRFYLDLSPRASAELVVVCGGVEHSTPQYAIHRPGFAFYAIEYVTAGLGDLRLGKQEHRLQPGAVFAYGPGVPQDIAGRGGEPLTKYFVNFAGARAAGLLREAGLPPGAAAQVFPATALQGIFEELVQSGLQGTRRSAGLCARLLECLALKIADARAPSGSAEHVAHASYRRARQHIEKHFLTLSSLEQISRECHLNNAYLCRLFRRYDHQSPYQFLLRLKMTFAAERLQQPGTLVKQVAADTGFADAFHFSRAFKQVFGLSPEAFRKLG